MTTSLRGALLGMLAVTCAAVATAAQQESPAPNSALAPSGYIASTTKLLTDAMGTCRSWRSQQGAGMKMNASSRMTGAPADASFRGEQAALLAKVLVDDRGNTRFAHVIGSMPTNVRPSYLRNALLDALGARFTPGYRGETPVASWADITITYTIVEPGVTTSMGGLLRQDQWLAMLEKANGGDVSAVRSAAFITAFISSETGLSRAGEDSLVVESALHGDPFGQLRVLEVLDRCPSYSIVKPWVEARASEGLTEFLLWQASDLVANGDADSVSKAAALLHNAARSPDTFTQLWLTGLFALHPDERLRDPEVALRLISPLMQDAVRAKDPDYVEAFAAAQAANGKFSEAAATEKSALKLAKRLKWNTSHLADRLAAYQAGRVWTGLLCDCQSMAPGRN